MPRTNLQRRSAPKLDRLKATLAQLLQQGGYTTGKKVAGVLGCCEATANLRLNTCSDKWKVGDVLNVLKAVGADSVELHFYCGVHLNGEPREEVVKLL